MMTALFVIAGFALLYWLFAAIGGIARSIK